MRRIIWTSVGLVMIFSGSLLAQTKTEFEVASIKPSAPDARGMFIRPGPGGGVAITNMSLKELIVIAWRIQPFQVSGGPSWLESVHYDIVAKPETKTAPSEISHMIQSLLKDRFQLAIHIETKELPIYALVLARKDGKLGPRLTESKEGGCTQPDPSKPPSPIKSGERPALGCGGMWMSRGGLTGVSVPVSNLAPALSRLLGRTVVNKTGLTGNFDISVEWAPEETPAMQSVLDAPKPASSDAGGPSIFTALQEQLGLKLESQKGPVEILVVEHAEKPSEN